MSVRVWSMFLGAQAQGVGLEPCPISKLTVKSLVNAFTALRNEYVAVICALLAVRVANALMIASQVSCWPMDAA